MKTKIKIVDGPAFDSEHEVDNPKVGQKLIINVNRVPMEYVIMKDKKHARFEKTLSESEAKKRAERKAKKRELVDINDINIEHLTKIAQRLGCQLKFSFKPGVTFKPFAMIAAACDGGIKMLSSERFDTAEKAKQAAKDFAIAHKRRVFVMFATSCCDPLPQEVEYGSPDFSAADKAVMQEEQTTMHERKSGEGPLSLFGICIGDTVQINTLQGESFIMVVDELRSQSHAPNGFIKGCKRNGGSISVRQVDIVSWTVLEKAK